VTPGKTKRHKTLAGFPPKSSKQDQEKEVLDVEGESYSDGGGGKRRVRQHLASAITKGDRARIDSAGICSPGPKDNEKLTEGGSAAAGNVTLGKRDGETVLAEKDQAIRFTCEGSTQIRAYQGRIKRSLAKRNAMETRKPIEGMASQGSSLTKHTAGRRSLIANYLPDGKKAPNCVGGEERQTVLFKTSKRGWSLLI